MPQSGQITAARGGTSVDERNFRYVVISAGDPGSGGHIAAAELDQFPMERRKGIIEGFNTSSETVALRERLSKLPFRLGAVLLMVVMGVMVLVYDSGVWQCTLAGLLCFAVGVPLGILFQMLFLRRALRRSKHRDGRAGHSGLTLRLCMHYCARSSLLSPKRWFQ
jgi:hypothetical protein